MSVSGDRNAQGGKRLSLTVGDWVDPSRSIERIHAQWYFCKAIETVVPEMVSELFALQPIVAEVVGPPAREDVWLKKLSPAYMAWCEKWNVPEQHWLERAGVNSLVQALARRKVGLPPIEAILPDRFGNNISAEQMTAELETRNPGWRDTGYQIVVPSMTFYYHPTQHIASEARTEIHQFLDAFLDNEFEKIAAELTKAGGVPVKKGMASTTNFTHFVWAVRVLILREQFRTIAKDYKGKESGVVASKIRDAVNPIARSLEFPN